MCKECGHTQSKWAGSCFSCNSWNSFVEEKIFDDKKKRNVKEGIAKPVLLKDVDILNFARLKTDVEEFDRLLGGGIVKGSLLLVGGAPGIGKSTLMLQISAALVKKKLKVLYVCGEESIEQTSIRAKRLNIEGGEIYLLNENLFGAIKTEIENIKPDIIVIDSIQVLYKEDILSSFGSVSQVKEIAADLMQLAKSKNIAIFMVGHVTKAGDLAGPRVLEHIVDVVLEFEGDSKQGFRFLRALKNRFGSTEEVAIFQMTEEGLKEVLNPSSAFLEERMEKVAGSVISATLEGVRSILVEAQALVTTSFFPMPTRKSSGIDGNRLALLLAVLEKRVGFQILSSDIFVSLAGGIKIVEPSIDLAVAMAIVSSFTNKVIDKDCVIMGEVGLGGEVRSVNRVDSRIREAINLGFKRCILPRRNLEKLTKRYDQIELVGVNLVDEAVQKLF
jgi:DNA repair protein RadA/Sms